jgi:hypothetical protein
VNQYEKDRDERLLSQTTDVPRILRIMRNDIGNNIYPLYKIPKKCKFKSKDILTLAKFVVLPTQTNNENICRLCYHNYTDVVFHTFMECPMLNNYRN